ncbi:DDX52 helicase, partial [Trogon melanurus]|nr:DDX52 helicase [Trogon melanurus]
IDFKGVNMVINYDLPTSAVEYIHRIGRTGRAGHTGRAVTFFTEDDKPLLRSIASVIQRAGCPVPDYIKHLPKLQRYVWIIYQFNNGCLCRCSSCLMFRGCGLPCVSCRKTTKENVKEKKKEDKNGSKLQTVSKS